jgi:hypothetical protein
MKFNRQHLEELTLQKIKEVNDEAGYRSYLEAPEMVNIVATIMEDKFRVEPAWKSWNWPMYTPFTPTNIIDRAKKESQEIEQILGKALGYPWYKDDPKNFPNATEADGVCIGPNTAASLAMEAADRIKNLEDKLMDYINLN